MCVLYYYMSINFKGNKGQRCSSVVEGMLNIQKTLGLTPTPKKEKESELNSFKF